VAPDVIAGDCYVIAGGGIPMLIKITKRQVDSVQPAECAKFLWDSQLKGFGLKVTPAGRKVYVLQYRMGGRGLPVKRYTIGNHGDYTPNQARNVAAKLRGGIRNNVDPGAAKRKAIADQRAAITIKQLCERYLENPPPKKSSTLATDKGRIVRHIVPLLGSKLVLDVTAGDIQRFMAAVATGKTKADIKTKQHGRAIVTGGKGTATRTVGLLGGIFSYAITEGYRTDNPVRCIKRYPDHKVERFLSSAELKVLGDVLSAAERAWNAYEANERAWRAGGKRGPKPRKPEHAENPTAITAIRLLLFTGCRKSEILTLKWEHVDFERQCLRLPDSKTGAKTVPLGAPALALLSGLMRTDRNFYVLPSDISGRHFVGLPKIWERIRKRAKLANVRLHDLRHSFASVGAAVGDSLLIIGKLLGHRDAKTTARYAHLADDPLKAAANRISSTIAAALAPTDEAELVRFKHAS
jgi:integrase